MVRIERIPKNPSRSPYQGSCRRVFPLIRPPSRASRRQRTSTRWSGFAKGEGIKGVLVVLFILLFSLIPGQALASMALTQEVMIDAARVALAKSRPFTLVYSGRKFTAAASEVNKWFTARGSGEGSTLKLTPDAVYNYLNVYVSPRVNQLGEPSRFKRIDGQVHLVSGGKKGLIVDGDKTSLAIRTALVAGRSSATVAMKEYRPTVFSANDFAKLKFPDKLAAGTSSFAGSPKNRVHNINVATKRFDGAIIMPNEEFSFNRYLGSVDAANNYLPELVIKENVTTPEYGGGICQVSTTAFRAALESGMKITARKNHSYPVAYYGTPGYDATVYSPAPDLKFVNDTGYPIYLETKIIGAKVIFDVWGTKAGREVRVNGPFVTERKPDGSLTAAVAQFVKKNGKTVREENFVSKYQSPDKFPTVVKANKG